MTHVGEVLQSHEGVADRGRASRPMRRGRWRVVWWVGGASVLAVLSATVYFLTSAGWLALTVGGVAALGIGVGYLIAVARFRYGLYHLFIGLSEARDGNLGAVAVPDINEPLLERVYRDYNLTITALDKTLKVLEQCQRRNLRQRDRIDAIMQALPAAVIVVDDDLNEVEHNRLAPAALGVPRLVGGESNLFDIIVLDDGSRERLRDAFLFEQPFRNWVVRMKVNRKPVWFSMNLSFVNPEENDLAAVVTLLDITDHILLQEEMYGAEKMVAMGQLAGGVAHELNTPLGTMLGYSQLMENMATDSEKVIEYAKVIGQEAKRCSRVVQSLLDYARKSDCNDRKCHVNALIEDAVRTLCNCRLRSHNILVESNLQGDPVVEMASTELDIVLTNLLSNAVQALEGHASPRIRITTRDDDSRMVTVVVEDNGPGVNPTYESKIFEPFFTTQDVGKGSGFGLSISQAMVMRRGGSLRYDPGYTDGARFVVRLPRAGRGLINTVVGDVVLHDDGPVGLPEMGERP